MYTVLLNVLFIWPKVNHVPWKLNIIGWEKNPCFNDVSSLKIRAWLIQLQQKQWQRLHHCLIYSISWKWNHFSEWRDWMEFRSLCAINVEFHFVKITYIDNKSWLRHIFVTPAKVWGVPACWRIKTSQLEKRRRINHPLKFLFFKKEKERKFSSALHCRLPTDCRLILNFFVSAWCVFQEHVLTINNK